MVEHTWFLRVVVYGHAFRAMTKSALPIFSEVEYLDLSNSKGDRGAGMLDKCVCLL